MCALGAEDARGRALGSNADTVGSFFPRSGRKRNRRVSVARSWGARQIQQSGRKGGRVKTPFPSPSLASSVRKGDCPERALLAHASQGTLTVWLPAGRREGKLVRGCRSATCRHLFGNITVSGDGQENSGSAEQGDRSMFSGDPCSPKHLTGRKWTSPHDGSTPPNPIHQIGRYATSKWICTFNLGD